MTVQQLRELLVEYPQDALVVRWDDPEVCYRVIQCTEIACVGQSDEGFFSVPMLHIS